MHVKQRLRPLARTLGRGALVVLLSALSACGSSLHFRYVVAATKPRVAALPTPRVPPAARAELARAQWVVLDLTGACEGADPVTLSRCASLTESLRAAIEQTGRKVLLAAQTGRSALELAAELSLAVVLRVEPGRLAWQPAGSLPATSLEDPSDAVSREAELLCAHELRAALRARNTQLRAELAVQWLDAASPSEPRLSQSAALEGELGSPPMEVEATYTPGSTASTSDDSPPVVVHNHHHHGHHCHHGHGHRSRSRDDSSAGLIAALLVVTVVGLAVVAAAEHQADGSAATCTIEGVPAVTAAERRKLAEQLDALLAERIASTLGRLAPEALGVPGS